MAISTSRTRVFSIATIIRRAYQLTGLMNAIESTADPTWTAKAEMAADFLDMGLKAMQANSILEKHVYRPTIAITGGTASYTIDSTILAVMGNAMYAVTGDDTEIPVVPTTREDYQAITQKTTDGVPARYWFDRYNNQIFLWPVPQDNGTLTIQAHRLIADGEDTANDVELERHWTEYLVFDLAYKLSLSNGLPLDRTSFFRVRANELLEAAQGYSKSSEPTFMVCTHRTGWSR